MKRRQFLKAIIAVPFASVAAKQTVRPILAADWGNSESHTVYTLVDKDGILAQYDFETEAWRIWRSNGALRSGDTVTKLAEYFHQQSIQSFNTLRGEMTP